MTHYPLRRAIGSVILAAMLLTACSCTKADNRASPVNTNDKARPPEGSDSDQKFFVIGTEMAKAVEAEKHWQQRGLVRESPLPKQGYDFWHGDQNLIDPAPNALDDTLREVVQRYAKNDSQERAAIRSSIGMDGFYTLMTFARRSAVFAIREKKAEIARDGLVAVSMINQERVDFRDILMCLSLLYHAANRAGADADKMFRQAAVLAEPEVGKQIVNFVERSPDGRDLRISWGFDEVETAKGLGLIGWGFKKYAPTVDLKSVVIDAAQLVAADKYLPDSVSVATELPPVWLSHGKNAELDGVLASVRGAATISARLRSNEHPKHNSQQFTMFIVETSQIADAQTLLRFSRVNDNREHIMIGVASGKLFALIVARSFVQGDEAYETPKSLARFQEGLTKILVQYADKVP